MESSSLQPAAGSEHSNNFRRGRGHGSGNGRITGKGHKGQRARPGTTRPGLEGGQMSLHKHLSKRGFADIDSKTIVGINVSTLERFGNDAEITVGTLIKTGTVKNPRDGVKIPGSGELTRKLIVKVNTFSEGAKSKIEALSGICEVI